MDQISIDNAQLRPQLTPEWKLQTNEASPSLDNQTLKERFEINHVTLMILELCDGINSVAQIIESLCDKYPESSEAIAEDVESVLRDLHESDVLEFIPTQNQEIFEVPQASPKHQKHKLCIGMATYDDYDGVYFSVQAIRLYHPEILEDTEIIIIDNHPDGPCADALQKLSHWVKSYRYIPCKDIRGTAVRDFVFREANAEYVMCMDSHVFVQPGAIKRLIEYFDEHPNTPDFLQGPLLSDNMINLSTHFKPEWSNGMYGTWGYDERAEQLDNDPFEIPMQGLGLFACRKDAWQGFNPRFSGFGGEEGYIHEKFRQAGARSLCLPFLRWLHRFTRPMGTRYQVKWEDRIRNYIIGRDELNLEYDDVVEHFIELLDEKTTTATIQAVESEMSQPLYYFDAIYYLQSEQRGGNWGKIELLLVNNGVSGRVITKNLGSSTQSEAARAAVYRDIFIEAKASEANNIIIFNECDAIANKTIDDFDQQVKDLSSKDWSMHRFQENTSVVAINRGVLSTLIDSIPSQPEEFDDWVKAGNQPFSWVET